MALEDELRSELKTKGADFVHFVDISQLAQEQNKRFPNAILFGMLLTSEYIQKITNTPDFVKNMVLNNQIKEDEFHLMEIRTDRLADYMANYLTSKGFSAYSQSEDNIELSGHYNHKTNNTPLPHKTIALMAGLGWIGKHNLLVTPEFGSAVSMCTVLTDAPLKTVLYAPAKSQCGDCTICVNKCSVNAIKGNIWKPGTPRHKIMDVFKCNTCLECLVFCPWTQSYMKKNS